MPDHMKRPFKGRRYRFSAFLSFFPILLLIMSPAISSSCDYRIVKEVIDGDTFVTDREERVRLLGIDSPEIGDPRKDVEWFGKEAAVRLKTLIAGKRVCLKAEENGTIDKDDYGRLLRYVWLDTVFVNARMISDGFAMVYGRQPFQYLDEFRELEWDAKTRYKGLWNEREKHAWLTRREREQLLSRSCGEEGTICPEKARQSAGKEATVRFFVRKAQEAEKRIVLNSRNDFRDPDNFTVVIFREDAVQFSGSPGDLFLNRTIDVSGSISLYDGRLEIIVRSPSQIRIVSGEPEK